MDSAGRWRIERYVFIVTTSGRRDGSTGTLTSRRLTPVARGRCRRRYSCSYGRVRALVFGQYGEASTDVHELLDITVDRATRDSWRFLGARSQAEARSYFTSTLRRAWGVATVREFARHRVSRLCFIGASRGQGAQAVRARSQGLLTSWAARSPAAFSAFAGRASGALSARRGVPRRA